MLFPHPFHSSQQSFPFKYNPIENSSVLKSTFMGSGHHTFFNTLPWHLSGMAPTPSKGILPLEGVLPRGCT